MVFGGYTLSHRDRALSSRRSSSSFRMKRCLPKSTHRPNNTGSLLAEPGVVYLAKGVSEMSLMVDLSDDLVIWPREPESVLESAQFFPADEPGFPRIDISKYLVDLPK